MKKFFVKHSPDTVVTNNGTMDMSPSEWTFEGVDIEIRDEYHSMHDLYQHRMALNIALFRAWHSNNEWVVVRSKLHADGTMFDGYFIVMAITSYGQISYHYSLKHWDKFNIPEVEKTPKWDGHGSLQVIERLMKL